MIYIVILIYTLYLSYRYDLKGNQANYKIHYRVLLTLTIAIVGFSYRLGMDTVGYMEYFDRVDSNILYTFTHLMDCRYEPIPEMLFSVCKRIWDDFALVQIVIGVFVNATVFWFLKKHSPMFFFSVFLYFIFQYWNLNFEIKRESVAICIFLIAVDRILKDEVKLKDYLWYYGICAIALFAHRFAFVTFIYPLFQNIKFSKIYAILIVMSLAVLSVNSTIVSSVLSNVNSLLASSSGEAIQNYLSNTRFGTGGITILGIIHHIVIPLIIVYSCRKESNRRIYSFALLYFAVLLLQSQVFIFYRITNYLFYFLAIVYSDFLKSAIVNIGGKSMLKYMFVFILFFQVYLLTGKSQHIRYMPYNSIFSKEINKEREATYRDLDYMLNY